MPPQDQLLEINYCYFSVTMRSGHLLLFFIGPESILKENIFFSGINFVIFFLSKYLCPFTQMATFPQ